MKLFLFKSVAAIASSLINVNISIGNVITAVIANAFNFTNGIVKGIAERLLVIIDKNRYEHMTLTTKQLPELTELNLLMAANKVKEDALSKKVWTIDHTMAMNRIGNALYTTCNWEPPKIHRYLRSVVESIPGMVYMSGDDYDDKSPV